jgi:outer membrane receptor protein involved in Fe transport
LGSLCPGADRIGSWNPGRTANGPNFWQLYGITYDPLAPYNPATIGLPINQGGSGAPNGGRGFYADLTGNDLPNAPRLTGNIGAQYTFFLEDDDWELTFRGDYYRQSKSYGRIYNTAFDRLRGWDNFNAAVTLARPASGFELQLYVKNMFNKTPITGFFVNSDDTGLTTNVFTPDPRIIGFNTSVRF